MDAKEFNKRIDLYINQMTPGAEFYAPLFSLLRMSETVKSVPAARIKELEAKIRFFDELKQYDLLVIGKENTDYDHMLKILKAFLLDAESILDQYEVYLKKLLNDIQIMRPLIRAYLRDENQKSNEHS